MGNPIPLCRLDEVPDGGSNGFAVDVDGTRQGVMVIRRGSVLHVYANRCPHVGLPLDFTPGQFLDPERTHIQCANHGALFRIEDGSCVSGPCAGAGLKPFQTRIVKGTVYITD
jgi:nitrite reductase/ring-hydroxylating ferredoxin subunit